MGMCQQPEQRLTQLVCESGVALHMLVPLPLSKRNCSGWPDDEQ